MVLGTYGSRSFARKPLGIEQFLREAGFEVAGTTRGGDPEVAEFAWVDLV
jgi:hypothetical protein